MVSEPVRVLVCDDDEPTRELLVAVLETEGFEVSSVPDGPSCLAALAGDPPDVLVLDVMMPGMDGYQVMEILRRDFPDSEVHVVMLTARTNDEDVWNGWVSGVDYYMAKPFDSNELVRFVHFLASGTPVD
jgi:two-component system alkaline phosphatase synthesis response regulator PhoP/two-component system response regulator VicR